MVAVVMPKITYSWRRDKSEKFRWSEANDLTDALTRISPVFMSCDRPDADGNPCPSCIWPEMQVVIRVDGQPVLAWIGDNKGHLLEACPRCMREAHGWSLKRADVCSPSDWANCIRDPQVIWSNAVIKAGTTQAVGAKPWEPQELPLVR